MFFEAFVVALNLTTVDVFVCLTTDVNFFQVFELVQHQLVQQNSCRHSAATSNVEYRNYLGFGNHGQRNCNLFSTL